MPRLYLEWETVRMNLVELSPAERSLLSVGLSQWGGPARPTSAMIDALGFSRPTFAAEVSRLRDRIVAGEALDGRDWTRALIATEIVFVSDVVGAGVEWEICTGLSDAETIATLRSLQRKLAPFRAPLS